MILQVEILAFCEISRTPMQIPYAKHVEAAATLTGRNRLEAALFLKRLRSRLAEHTFYGEYKNAVVLVTEGAGSIATFMTSTPTQKNIEKLNLFLRSAKKSIAHKGISTAHALLGEEDQLSIHLFEDAGFTKLATLHYMEWDALSNQSHIPQSNTVTFCETSSLSPTVLETTMVKTYIGSLDCPAIHGKRDIKEIIKGHQGFNPSDLSLWFIVLMKDEPAGVLLLNQPNNEQYLELAYLGITPMMRKKGLAKQALEHALNHAIKRGCKKIILAVDGSNIPAINLYKKANFQETAKRIAMFCPLR